MLIESTVQGALLVILFGFHLRCEYNCFVVFLFVVVFCLFLIKKFLNVCRIVYFHITLVYPLKLNRCMCVDVQMVNESLGQSEAKDNLQLSGLC